MKIFHYKRLHISEQFHPLPNQFASYQDAELSESISFFRIREFCSCWSLQESNKRAIKHRLRLHWLRFSGYKMWLV